MYIGTFSFCINRFSYLFLFISYHIIKEMSKMVIFISITKEYLKASLYVFFRVKAIKEQDIFKLSARTQVNKYSLIRKGSCA